MAQDAELKLKVSLDLAFFRQQLSTVGAQLSGQSIPIAIKFDKKAIADQYRLLDRYIRGKKFTVELNLVGGLTKNEFDKIKGRLDDLRNLRKVEIPVGVKNGATSKDVDKVVTSIKERLANNQQIKQGGGKLRIETSIKPSITNQDIADFKKAAKDKLSKLGALEVSTKLEVPKVEDLLKGLQKNFNRQKPLLAKTSIKPSILSADVKAFKKAVESKLSGITVKINAELETIGGGKTKAQIEKEVLAGLDRIQQIGAARMGGGVTEPARRESLRQSLQGRDIGELKDIGRQLGVANVGKFRNTQNLIEKIVTEASIEMITKYLDPQAVMRNPDRSGLNKVLDTFARGLFNMLGMDIASMRQQAAQRRALPGVDFPATVPSRPVSIGPSGTGRALPPGAIPGALPGTAFGAQKYLPTNLGIELQEILRKAAYAFVDAVRREVRTVKIGIGASMQAALPAARIAGLLPAGVGRAPSTYSTGAIGGESREQMMARRTAEAYARSALRGMDVMGGGAGRPPSPYSYAYRSARPTSAIVPYAAAGAMVAGPRQEAEPLTGQATPFASPLPKNYLEIGKAIKSLDPILQRSSVPFSGAIRELGEEFGFAIKQVLLFGTAYKALAFFTDLPAQTLNASKELQSFNNQLNAITGSSSNAQRSVQFINDTVAQFNVPLQSAREGFLRLYASMSPAGMEADTIENLFVGISQASATLGLSADQVDRVTYAFSQMASKGKVMSEEVTGQLGDVIPGALSLMADAAGMSMAEFKDAMEAGQVSGKAMEQLFTNLPIVMEQRFGKGAAGAAKTLQGQLNNLATTAQRMYESFEPLVTSIANQILPIVSAAMKDTQGAVEAFGLKMQGINPAVSLLSDNAQGLYRSLEIVYDMASSVVSVIQSLGGVFSTLGGILSGSLQLFNAIAANPVGEFFVKLAVNIAIATTAINLFVRSGIIAAAQQLLLFIGNIQLTIGSLRTLIATSRAAKIAVGGIIAGGIMVGLELLLTHLTDVRKETDKLKNSALAAADAIRQMSYSQLIEQERSVKKLIQNIETLQRAAGGAMRIARPTLEQERMAREAGLPIIGRAGQRAISMTRAEGIRQQALEKLPEIRRGLEAPAREAVTTITPLDLSEGEGKSKKKTRRQLSVDDLIGGAIKRKLDEQRSKLEVALAKELNRAASAVNAKQAERMVKSAAKLLDIKYQIDAIDKTLTAREAVRAQIIASSQDKAATALAFDEQTNDLKAARANLERDIEKAIIEQQGAAERQAREEREEIERTRKERAKEIEENIKGFRDQIALLRAIGEEEQKRLKIAQENKDATAEQLNQIYDLERVRDNIKAVRETIDGFVTDTSSDYKGFLKEVISGEDAVEALKKFQEGLRDRTLTIFLDFAMAPVEKFFKEMASGGILKMFFPETAAEQAPEEKLVAPVEANTSAIHDNTSAIHSLTAAIGGAAPAVTGTNIGNDLARQLSQERGYEDIAGLQPLPLQKMLQQIGRPLTILYRQIEDARNSLYPYSKREVNKMLAPNPARTQTILQRAQAVEKARQSDPAEAQWKERENRWRTDKRSSPASASLSAFEGVTRQISGEAFKQLNKMGAIYGILDDVSDYLNEGQLEVLRKGVREQLNQGVSPSRMPIGGNVNTGRANIRGAIQAITKDVLEEIRLETTRDVDGIDMDRLMRLNEPPRIRHGIESQFEGAMLPGGEFDISKISQSFGEIATASNSLSGILANMTNYSTGLQENAQMVNSSLANISQTVDETGKQMSPDGAAGSRFGESLGKLVQGIGAATGSIMGIVGGVDRIMKGGTSNVAGGIGSILLSVLGMISGGMFKGTTSTQGGGFGSFSGSAFGIDAGGSPGQVGQNLSIRPFANGGIVTGPTMGLIGEGRYNEAVVPLPDGKSIPVDLGGSMGDSGVNIVVNVDAKGTNVQGDNQMGKQLGGAISAAVQAELIKQKRPGGLLAR